MARSDIHYEVFLKKHKKSSWTLVEANDDRQAALDLAHRLKNRHPKGSVRVRREVWTAEENAFHGGTIFETGPEKFAAPEDKTGEASLPCVTPDDFVGAAARDTIRRVLSAWFERRQVAPLELLHRPDLIEELDSSDTDLQHAVQKVAIARAQNSDASVHAYVRILNDLVEKGIAQARREAKRKKNKPRASDFSKLVEAIHAEGSPERRLRAAIADELADIRDFTGKTDRLLELCDSLPPKGEARDFALRETDNFLAETLSFDTALRGLVGRTDDLGEEIQRLTAIYEGAPTSVDLDEAPDRARKLARHFADNHLPTTHIEIAKRILGALRAPKRFRPDSVMAEIELARKLAQRLIVASGPNLHPDSLVDAFTHRSAKLLAPEAVDEALANANDPADQIERLYRMEDNLVGRQNKAKLSGYIRARLTGPKAESFFVRGPGRAMEKLARLTQLQARALRGSFPDIEKTALSEAFDRLGLAILDESKILNRLAASGQPPLEQARAFLKLAAGGVLPAGRCAQDAQARAMRVLANAMGQKAAALPENRAVVLEIQSLIAALTPKHSAESDATDASAA